MSKSMKDGSERIPPGGRPGQATMAMHLVALGYSARVVVEAFDLAPLLSSQVVQFELDLAAGLTRFVADPRSLDELAGAGDT